MYDIFVQEKHQLKPRESLGVSGFSMVLKNSGLKTNRSGEFFRPRKPSGFLSVKNCPQFLKGGDEV